jgi:hypothetical protein
MQQDLKWHNLSDAFSSRPSTIRVLSISNYVMDGSALCMLLQVTTQCAIVCIFLLPAVQALMNSTVLNGSYECLNSCMCSS